jgi:oligoribonuclease NrnB/cAMP/cGMP phosphodiesterase (DHH superfamily)
MTIILHHDDLDGRCAGHIALRALQDARCFEMSYGEPTPFEEMRPDELVVIVDFSLQRPGDWDMLREITSKICWIDHHETAITAAPQWLHATNQGSCAPERCGAWLVWYYFYPHLSVPEVVRLIDLWDRWQHYDSDTVLDFGSGMKLQDTKPGAEIWDYLFSSRLSGSWINSISKDGEMIRQYERIRDHDLIKRHSFIRQWEGHSCRMFWGYGNSKTFDSVKGKEEILVLIEGGGDYHTVSLYSDTVKVNDIAVKYHGGGHPGAAGFQCKQLPWEGSA